ncbi:phosphotransferase [Stutzerimonas sp. VN223-3]|uniref:toluene tolerance protein n=1 Tax=Stutzerimonas sp. VN223-3 TaxID=3384601 RepID=UPI0038B432CE
MRIVTAQELESWLAGGTVLERDSRGPKVVALENQLFLKIFHTRRHPALARLHPAALRFARNAALLESVGVAAPTVVDSFWLDRAQGLSGCLYQPLPGVSLETLFEQSPSEIHRLLPELASFIHQLHDKRLYFRSLHVGNILLVAEGRFGLIDFLDLKRNAFPLTKWHIRRNLRHLISHLDRRKLKGFPATELFQLYFKGSRGNEHTGTMDSPK